MTRHDVMPGKPVKNSREKPPIKIKAANGKKSAEVIRSMRVRKPVKSAVKSAPGSRQARGLVRRDAILSAALDEFSARGYDATRLDDVAKRAGVAKGTIYLYFRDKEQLFQELVRSMLMPLIGAIEAMGAADVPFTAMAEHIVDLFVREIYETRRKDVIRLMIAEGRRFPELAEFYYRTVLSRVIAAMRALLARAAARGEVPPALVDFPQILVAPGLIAIIWNDLFGQFAPLDGRAMMKAHIESLLSTSKDACR